MHPSKRKGDEAERELARLLAAELGYPVRRALGAGRLDDVGDIHGLPGWVLQVAARRDIATAVRVKPTECERQQANAGATHGAVALRLTGGGWRFVLTEMQFIKLVRETM